MEAAWTSETPVSYLNTHDATTQKTSIYSIFSVETVNVCNREPKTCIVVRIYIFIYYASAGDLQRGEPLDFYYGTEEGITRKCGSSKLLK